MKESKTTTPLAALPFLLFPFLRFSSFVLNARGKKCQWRTREEKKCQRGIKGGRGGRAQNWATGKEEGEVRKRRLPPSLPPERAVSE